MAYLKLAIAGAICVVCPFLTLLVIAWIMHEDNKERNGV